MNEPQQPQPQGQHSQGGPRPENPGRQRHRPRPFGGPRRGGGRPMPYQERPAQREQNGERNGNGDGESLKIPPAGENIRIIPLGGVEEIGKNMTIFEYKDDIIVVDMGFQFREEETPGIDYILPNTKYLEDRKDKIRAVIITHGHLDHIGAIPFIMPKIGNPMWSRWPWVMMTARILSLRSSRYFVLGRM